MMRFIFFIFIFFINISHLHANNEDIIHWNTQCEAGNAEACIKIYIYFNTEKIDTKKSYNAIQKACKLGSNIACYEQSNILESSIINEIHDPQQAKKINESLCKNGFKIGCIRGLLIQRETFYPDKAIETSNMEIKKLCENDGLLEACYEYAKSVTNMIGFPTPIPQDKLKSLWIQLIDKFKNSCDDMGSHNLNRLRHCRLYISSFYNKIYNPDPHIVKYELSRLCQRDKDRSCLFVNSEQFTKERCVQGSSLACWIYFTKSLETNDLIKLSAIKEQINNICLQGHSHFCNMLIKHYISKGESEKSLYFAEISCAKNYDSEGCMYYGMFNSEENKTDAMKYLSFSCQMGNSKSCQFLAFQFIDKKQAKPAIANFERACHLSEWGSCYFLAKYFNQEHLLEKSCQNGQGHAQACIDMIQKYKEKGKEPHYRVEMSPELLPVEDIYFPARIIPNGTKSQFEDRYMIRSQITFSTNLEVEGGIDALIMNAKAAIRTSTGSSFEESNEKVRTVELIGNGTPLIVVRRLLYKKGYLIVSLGFKQISMPFSYVSDFDLIVKESNTED